jgi:thiol-disulfide isomerase/thioredoxin
MVAVAGLLGVGAMAVGDQLTGAGEALQPRKRAVTLRTGSRAPALSVEKWVKGEPVKRFEPGKVYVVEFWATWCAPCVQGMPHLTELQERYRDKGVTVIAVTSRDSNNTLEKVEALVAEKGGEGMGFTVAWDRGRESNEAYLSASGQTGIPCAFVVNQEGKLAFIGHPMWLDLPLEKVVAGEWDIEAGRRQVTELERKLEEVYDLSGRNAMAALAALRELEKGAPVVAKGLGDLKFMLLLRSGKREEAYAVGREVVAEAKRARDAAKLNRVARVVVDPSQGVKEPDLGFAAEAAEAAVEVTGEKDSACLDTLAMVLYLKGEAGRAAAMQAKAVALVAEGPAFEELRRALATRLRQYESAAAAEGK